MADNVKPWAGRFTTPTDKRVERFTASVGFDQRLYRYDIAGSIAHARMLAKVGALAEKDRDAIIEGLQRIQAEIESGEFAWSVELEDVHMNIEARLIDRIGEADGRMVECRVTLVRSSLCALEMRWPSYGAVASRFVPNADAVADVSAS